MPGLQMHASKSLPAKGIAGGRAGLNVDADAILTKAVMAAEKIPDLMTAAP